MPIIDKKYFYLKRLIAVSRHSTEFLFKKYFCKKKKNEKKTKR